MTRYQHVSLHVAAVVLAALLAGGANAQNVLCSPRIGPGRVDGGVDIASRCELTGTDVRGDVTVFSGGSLVARNVRIRGTLFASRADFVDLDDTRVDGDLRLEEMVGDLNRIEDADVRGDVALLGNRSRLELLDNVVREGMEIVANTGGVLLRGNRIDESLECADNSPAPAGDENRVGAALGQCETLQAEVPQIAPPPAPTPTPTPTPSPPDTGAPPPSSPEAPFVPDPEGGGAGASGLACLLLLPAVLCRRRLMRLRQH
jgi:hypothetical protein